MGVVGIETNLIDVEYDSDSDSELEPILYLDYYDEIKKILLGQGQDLINHKTGSNIIPEPHEQQINLSFPKSKPIPIPKPNQNYL